MKARRDLVPLSLHDLEERDAACKRLGFQKYAYYLRSQLWDRIRAKVLAESDRTCFLCGMHAVCVHHATYTEAAIRGTDLDGLYALCWACHEKMHYRDGNYRPLREAAKDLGRRPENVAEATNLTSARTTGTMRYDHS